MSALNFLAFLIFPVFSLLNVCVSVSGCVMHCCWCYATQMWSFGLQTVEVAEEGDEDDDQVPHQGRHSSRLESRAAVHATKRSWSIKSRGWTAKVGRTKKTSHWFWKGRESSGSSLRHQLAYLHLLASLYTMWPSYGSGPVAMKCFSLSLSLSLSLSFVLSFFLHVQKGLRWMKTQL